MLCNAVVGTILIVMLVFLTFVLYYWTTARYLAIFLPSFLFKALSVFQALTKACVIVVLKTGLDRSSAHKRRELTFIEAFCGGFM